MFSYLIMVDRSNAQKGSLSEVDNFTLHSVLVIREYNK